MTGNHRNPTASQANPRQDRTVKRTQRSIRFSDAEWKTLRKAALDRGIAPSEFVRNAATHAAAAASSADSGAVPPEILALIKNSFRYTFILATLKRNDMIKDGRRTDIERVVELAHEAQNELLSSS